LGLLVSQVISRPLIQLSNIAGEIANGNLSVRARQETNDEIGALAKSFNYMTEQLFQTLSSLEQRVSDRTRALATATEVSRRLSTILDEKQLVTEVVEQVQKAYNYYHGQIYLLDASGQTLVLAGATGEGGKALLDKKHSLSIERGLVGRSARTKAAVLVPDTSKDPEWLPNPLLPDTKAEIAIPILLGETLVGVLDMQDDVTGDIYPEDIEYLTAISNQTAIALQNARSLAQAQKKAEREELITSIGQKIQQEATVESALKVAIREVGRALGTSTSIKLKPGNEEKQEKVQ
jgi:GAF domain-containing protein/HAMP domain-containing protein